MQLDKAEFRTAETFEVEGHKLSGYAAIFNRPTVIKQKNGNFTEVFMPGCFTPSLKNDVIFCMDHNEAKPVGRFPDNTELREDATGLYYSRELDDRPSHVDIMKSVNDRTYKGCSIHWIGCRDEWKGNTRYIHEANLQHISLVMRPAYSSTSAEMRSIQGANYEALLLLLAMYQKL